MTSRRRSLAVLWLLAALAALSSCATDPSVLELDGPAQSTGECSQNADCTSGGVCDTAAAACVECLANTDCSGTDVCDTSRHVCTAAVECTSDANCTTYERPHCSPAGACVACVSDEQCTSGDNGVCVGGVCVDCRTNADCGANVCNPFVGECVNCLTNADCGTGAMCNVAEGECEPACASNADCTDGDRLLCDVANGACVECLAPTDCPESGEACTDGECR